METTKANRETAKASMETAKASMEKIIKSGSAI
jgi:hypothetical protein